MALCMLIYSSTGLVEPLYRQGQENFTKLLLPCHSSSWWNIYTCHYHPRKYESGGLYTYVDEKCLMASKWCIVILMFPILTWWRWIIRCWGFVLNLNLSQTCRAIFSTFISRDLLAEQQKNIQSTCWLKTRECTQQINNFCPNFGTKWHHWTNTLLWQPFFGQKPDIFSINPPCWMFQCWLNTLIIIQWPLMAYKHDGWTSRIDFWKISTWENE